MSEMRIGMSTINEKENLLFFSEYSRVMETFKFSLVLRTPENTDVFITLDENSWYNIWYSQQKGKHPGSILLHAVKSMYSRNE